MFLSFNKICKILLICTLAIILLYPFEMSIMRSYHLDKLAHAVVFGACTGVFLHNSTGNKLKTTIFMVILSGVIESIQPIFGRDADLSDYIANLTGIIIAVSFKIFYTKPKKPSQQ